MKLISEEISNAEMLVEEAPIIKRITRLKVSLQSDIKNRNGRIYENDILTKEVKDNQEFINKKRLTQGIRSSRCNSTVNLERVSHMITKLQPEAKILLRAKIMDTPYGKIVKAL